MPNNPFNLLHVLAACMREAAMSQDVMESLKPRLQVVGRAEAL